MKKATETHTPTPWDVTDMRIEHKRGQILLTSGLKVVATVPSNKDGEADAAFIVRAVNYHDALVNELKNAARVLKKEGYNIAGLNALLAKATGA